MIRALENDTYDRGDSEFTATELILPPQIRALRKKHVDEIEEDHADRLWALFGQLGHQLLEKAGGKNEITERRFFGDIRGHRISAQLDSLSLNDNILSDWKMTSVWSFMGREPKFEYIAQMNIQLELLRQNGLDADVLQIVGLLRDWKIRDKLKYKNYPKVQVAVQRLPMWPREYTEGYIYGRILLHKEAEEKGIWPECTADERYNNDQRCTHYCNVAKFCEQHRKQVDF